MMRSDGIKKRPGGTAILLAFVLFLFFPAAAYAQEGTAAAAETDGMVHIYDEAGLLSGSESEQLEQRCQQIETQSQIHILMVTTEDTQGKSQMEYADDFYDDIYPEKKDENGVLVLIDIGKRVSLAQLAAIAAKNRCDRHTALGHDKGERAVFVGGDLDLVAIGIGQARGRGQVRARDQAQAPEYQARPNRDTLQTPRMESPRCRKSPAQDHRR